MDIEEAISIPMAEILYKLNHIPLKTRGDTLQYLSPIRDTEKTPSFHVDIKKNRWYDHGIGKGGNVIHFVCAFLAYKKEASTKSDALRFINIMGGAAPCIKPVSHSGESIKKEEEAPKLVLKSVDTIQHIGLIRYLESRGISVSIAQQHLKEALVHNTTTKKMFKALALLNEEEGYELSNRGFKSSIRPKGLSVIKGTEAKADGLHIFEGMHDFLTVLTRLKTNRLKHDAIILNSLSFLEDVTPYIQGYGYTKVYDWLDNDKAGIAARKSLQQFLQTEPELVHKPMNTVYEPYKDVNEWHMKTLSLS